MEAPRALHSARGGRPFATTPDHPVNFLRASSTAAGAPVARPSRRRSNSLDLTAITSASTRRPSRRRSKSFDCTSFAKPTPPSRRGISNHEAVPRPVAPHLTPPSSRRGIVGEFEGTPTSLRHPRHHPRADGAFTALRACRSAHRRRGQQQRRVNCLPSCLAFARRQSHHCRRARPTICRPRLLQPSPSCRQPSSRHHQCFRTS